MTALVLASLLLGGPGQAEARPQAIQGILAVAKLPNLAFDIAGLASSAPLLEQDWGNPDLQRATRTSVASHGLALGLHGLSSLAFGISSAIDQRWEPRATAPFVLAALADGTVAAVGLGSGIDLLVRTQNSGLGHTAQGRAATWSGAINVAMGTIGAVWVIPMVSSALVSGRVVDAKPPRAPGRRPALAALRLGLGAGGTIQLSADF